MQSLKKHAFILHFALYTLNCLSIGTTQNSPEIYFRVTFPGNDKENFMQPQTIPYLSEDEYLGIERNSEIKHEYFEGEIFAMSGASRKHNLIAANVIITLGSQLKKKPCRVYPSDMRLKIERTKLYTYPDVMIVCGKDRFADDREDMLLNPDVIIEVLSDSTETYDRGKKFEHYRQIASLKEYVLISQHDRKIEKFMKTEDRRWIWDETDENNPEIILESVGCSLNLDEVYDKVF
jgi:Uma2 family endonuclease